MKDIAHDEMAQLLSREGNETGHFDTSIELLKRESIDLRCQLEETNGDTQFSSSESVERVVLQLRATREFLVESEDLELTYYYSAKFRFTKYELANIGFNDLFRNSLYDEESGIRDHNVIGLTPSSTVGKNIAYNADFLKVLLKQKIEGYLVENEGLLAKSYDNEKVTPKYFRLRSDTDFDLCFEGVLRGSIGDDRNGQLSLYETNDECPVFVCRRVLPSGTIETHVCHTTDEIIEFFGFTKHAKELYEKCDYRHTRKVSEAGLYYEEKTANEEGRRKYPVV